jgi:hypothetical protein
MPSVTQVPLLLRWQYCEPESTAQYALDGAGIHGGIGGDGIGGGGEGDGGGGDAWATGVLDAQMTQPPYDTEASENHVNVSPAAITTFCGGIAL